MCVGITNLQCVPGSREMTSLSNCNLPDALIRRWEKSVVLPLVSSSALCCLILGMTLVFFSRVQRWNDMLLKLTR